MTESSLGAPSADAGGAFLIERFHLGGIMAPMTMGSNLPYRRLCQELGAAVTMGEMAVSRQLLKGSRKEQVLLRRAKDEVCFGVQLAGRSEDELERATALAVEGGASFVDLNCGCPIDEFTRRGLGSALLRQPRKLEKLVAAMVRAAGGTPITAKIRLGWGAKRLSHIECSKASEAGGAFALTVHGRTRQARYRKPASWEHVAEVVQVVGIPVIGNGDILHPGDAERAREASGCAGVMIARGALIKPWIFRELRDGSWDPSGEDRWAIYRRYVKLGREHWGNDDYATARIRQFLLWHVDFWSRYVPPGAEGELSALQDRESEERSRSPLEALLYRKDKPAQEHVVSHLLGEGPGELLPGPPQAE